jgi:hypothetical protein
VADLRVALLGYGYWGPNLARNLHHQLGTGWTACADQRASSFGTLEVVAA